MDTRHKDANWMLPTNKDGKILGWEAVKLAVLMDIRDELKANTAELQRMNNVIQCSNFIRIPQVLKRISANTANLEKRKKP